MNAVEELVNALIDRGMEPAAAAILVVRAGTEMSTSAPSKGAERTRRWRERRASQTVTERHTETDDRSAKTPSQTVTNRHSDVTGDNRSSLSSSEYQPLEASKKEKKEEAKRRHVGFVLPDDWEPREKHYREASEHGRSPLDVQQLGEEMRLWSKANAHRAVARKSDWDSTFTGWMRREWGKLNGAQNGAGYCQNRTNKSTGPRTAAHDAIVAGMAAALSDHPESRFAGRNLDEDTGEPSADRGAESIDLFKN